jgi:hypothetical protein
VTTPTTQPPSPPTLRIAAALGRPPNPLTPLRATPPTTPPGITIISALFNKVLNETKNHPQGQDGSHGHPLLNTTSDYVKKLLNETKDLIPASRGNWTKADLDTLRNSTGDFIKKLLNETEKHLSSHPIPTGNWTKPDFSALLNSTKEFIREKLNETKSHGAHGSGNWTDLKRHSRPSPSPTIIISNRKMLA